MLTTEEASARLDALRDENWRAAARRRVGGLRRGLRGTAEAFLAARPAGRGRAAYQMYLDEQEAAARRLDELPAEQRAAIMNALHPGLGPALTRWWTDAQARPYQRGWDRQAFRSARAPGLTVRGRGADLAELIERLGPFEADPVWLAGWGGHLAGHVLSPSARTLGGVLASAIDLGGRCGEETLAALMDVGTGEHPVGIMGHHVIVGLLSSARPEGWDFTGRLLLAAQRQEGLRQAVLEAADEGCPQAFDRILALVLDHKLLRFAAGVRAAGVWLGFRAAVTDIPQVEARVRTLARFRADLAARGQALAGRDPWDAYLALCALGMRDVLATVPEAETLARHPDPDVRAAALRYGAATGLTAGQHMIAAALDDEDVRVASLAVTLLNQEGWELPGTFGALTRLIPRLPAPGRAGPVGVEAIPVRISQAQAASQLIRARGSRPAGDLLPWLPVMNATGRAGVLFQIAREPVLTPDLRQVVVGRLGDRSSHVRQYAIGALTKARLGPAEAPAVEALLTRRTADLRRGALTLLASLPPDAARASADRLAASADHGQRAAAAELRRTLDGGHRDPAPARTACRTPRPPRRREKFGGGAARQILQALDDIAEEHRNTPVLVSSWQGGREMLFGDLPWLPGPFTPAPPGRDGADHDGRMLLGEVFRGWWESRPRALRGDDGLDALRAHVTAELTIPRSPYELPGDGGRWWRSGLADLVGGPPPKLRHPHPVRHVAAWLAADCASRQVIEECLDALETTLAGVPRSALTAAPVRPEVFMDGVEIIHVEVPWSISAGDWRNALRSHPWLELLRGLLRTRPGLFAPEQITRWYQLMRWVEQPCQEAKPLPVDDRLLVAAHETGAASDGDVVASFLHPRSVLFRDLTRHWRNQARVRHPGLTVIADEVRDRLVAAELRRGDLPTPTSRAARNIGSTCGATLVTRLLALLGRTPLVRGLMYGSESRDAVFSHLIRVCFPAPDDTADTLARAARAAGLADARLVDLAVYAPQWAPLAEQALGWPGLTDGVLWLHAHTKDERWTIDRELRESWAAMTAERTPLSAADLLSGAVDVMWFRASHAALGAERWAVLHQAAKHASGGRGHRRAQVFAEAMLGHLDESALTEQIKGSRSQDAARALGLLPLPSAARDPALQRRYAVLREFERGSRAFGSQRQASERTAVRIGIENLARTAGYASPQRFVWTVEASQAADLAAGPVTVTHGDVTLQLSVTGDGHPDLSIRKGQRPLRTVPAALRKTEEVVALRARKAALAQQAARIREVLEAAMVAQDTFTARDVAGLRRHPLVAPVLGTLVWVDGQGQTLWQSDGRARAADGTPVAVRGPLRVAHPADLVADSSWVTWQERLFAGACRQPFKQVFRELYALTATEREASPVSRRYEGHQLQPRQALALFGRRGWVTSRDDGLTSRAFHDHHLVARVEFAGGFLTPLEADLPAIAGVWFTRHGERLAQPLASVPPVVFSETMRDLDLVVSVAHAGGVDPEATASTIEMRAALVRETARLTKLPNVSVAGVHVLIQGHLGEYSLHLGSGTVHRRPGGAICIVPVGSQHRGRLFLPFADDDPKTAEIVSKTLLLARDRELRDPMILGQLR